MENVYKLPLYYTSKIMHYNNYATSFGILNANHISCDLLIIKYFLDVRWSYIRKKLRFNTPYSYRWEYFESKLMTTSLLDSEFVHKIISAINDGFYIYLTVDEYYIPNRSNYLYSHCVHDIYVYGYDLSKKAFICVAYNDKLEYKEQYIKFERLKKAFFMKLQQFVFIGFRVLDELPTIDISIVDLQRKLLKITKNLKSKLSWIKYIQKTIDEIEFEDDIIPIKELRFLMDYCYVLGKLDKIYKQSVFKNVYILSKQIFLRAVQFKSNKQMYLIKEIKSLLGNLESELLEAIQAFLNNVDDIE